MCVWHDSSTIRTTYIQDKQGEECGGASHSLLMVGLGADGGRGGGLADTIDNDAVPATTTTSPMAHQPCFGAAYVGSRNKKNTTTLRRRRRRRRWRWRRWRRLLSFKKRERETRGDTYGYFMGGRAPLICLFLSALPCGCVLGGGTRPLSIHSFFGKYVDFLLYIEARTKRSFYSTQRNFHI